MAEVARKDRKECAQRRQPPLQAARGADPEQRAHQDAEIAGRDVEQVALADVVDPAHPDPAPAAAPAGVREAAFDILTAAPLSARRGRAASAAG